MQPRPIERKGNILNCFLEDVIQDIENMDIPQRIKEIREEGVQRAFEIGVCYLHQGFDIFFVQKIVFARVKLLLQAYTAQEIDEILKLSIPKVQKNGWYVTDKTHIPEEEIALLVIASRQGKLNKIAQQRLVYLCETYLNRRFKN